MEANDDSDAPRRDALDRTAKTQPFYELAADDAFPADELDRVTSLIEDSSWVSRWLDRAMLVFGLTLLAVGVVFFFAFNWDQLPDLAKLGVVQVGFAGALVAGTLRDLHSVTSRILLVVAGVLVGVHLAVFGQVYQTGADTWQLFALWAVILCPLAILAGTQGAWVLFGAIASLAGINGVDEAFAGSSRSLEQFAKCMCVLGASAGVLAVVEHLRARGGALVEAFPWSRPLLLITGFGALTLHICLTDGFSHPTAVFALSILILIAASIAAVWVFTYALPDIVAHSVVGVSWLIVVVWFSMEFFFSKANDGLAGFLFMGIITLSLTAGLVAILRWVHSRLTDIAREAS